MIGGRQFVVSVVVAETARPGGPQPRKGVGDHDGRRGCLRTPPFMLL